MAGQIDGIALGCVAAGGLLVYAGINRKSVPSLLTGFIQGKSPASATTASGISTTAAASGGSAPAPTASNATASENQALAQQLATSMGHSSWTTGQEWSDWVALWNQESSWQDEANPNSSARGIAQNINGYGPDYIQGDMASQITWGINYIAGRYGSPSAAWAHEQQDDWY